MPHFENPGDDAIRAILARPRRIAVVGCSPEPSRDSHRIAKLLLARGHDVVPVNPATDEILGRHCYPTLAAIPGSVEMVDVFRRSDQVAAIAAESVAVGARILWLQLGVIDRQAAESAVAAGLIVVMDRCPAIEYPRLFGGTYEVDAH